MIRVLPLVIFFVVAVAGPWYFLKNPIDAVYCLMSGNEWANQGNNKRFCRETFGDAGKLCFASPGCDSGKCVIGTWGRMSGVNKSTGQNLPHDEITLGVFGGISDELIMGKCSYTNQDPCYSGEMIIDANRIVHTPVQCE